VDRRGLLLSAAAPVVDHVAKWRRQPRSCWVAELSASMGGGSSSRERASAIRIFFLKRQWYELRETLIRGPHYFLEAVRYVVCKLMVKLKNWPSGTPRGRPLHRPFY